MFISNATFTNTGSTVFRLHVCTATFQHLVISTAVYSYIFPFFSFGFKISSFLFLTTDYDHLQFFPCCLCFVDNCNTRTCHDYCWHNCKETEVGTITDFFRRRRPKTGTKRSQTGGRATACSSWGTLTQNCISPAGVAMGMSSNVVNTPVGVMGTSWQLAISSRNMLTCSLALLNWCLRETGVVACVCAVSGGPSLHSSGTQHGGPRGLALAIVAMVTIKGIIDRVQQKKLCDWLRWKLS